MMGYSTAFKIEAVRKMSGSYSRSATELARETGVSQTTLSRWKREADKIVPMPKRKTKNQKRPDDRTPQEKFELILKAKQLSEEELGEFLRSNGIHKADLDRWEAEAFSGMSNKKSASEETKKIRDLRKKLQDKDKEIRIQNKEIREQDKEIRRKDKALAEAAALLVLQKKVREIWGDGDDDIQPGKGK